MHYVAIDLHKRYSVCSALNEQGQRTGEARIDGNRAAGFAQYFRGLGGPSQVVIEATWNWGRVHDLLEQIHAAISAPPDQCGWAGPTNSASSSAYSQ